MWLHVLTLTTKTVIILSTHFAPSAMYSVLSVMGRILITVRVAS